MDRHLPPFRRALARGFALILTVFGCAPWTAGRWALGAETTVTVAENVDQPIVESKASYVSQGKTITIERYEPRAPGKYPAVLVVHGAGGMTLGGHWFRDSARMLARHGYVTHLVHYFDVSGTRVADKPTMRAHFPAWMRVLADGVSNVSRQPNVDPGRVGLLGFSLGSYLSVSLAMFDTRVLAVVDYYGGLPDELYPNVKTLPPTLILHGEADLIVPVSESRELEALCKARNVLYEMHIYPGQGHGFLGDSNLDASRRTLAFFETHVKAARPVRVTREAAIVPKLDLFAVSGEKTGGGK